MNDGLRSKSSVKENILRGHDDLDQKLSGGESTRELLGDALNAAKSMEMSAQLAQSAEQLRVMCACTARRA
jgi:hypothetical protein